MQNLSQQLKDAGLSWKCHCRTYDCPLHDDLPTLSELIQACGEDFMLTNECDIWEAWKGSVSDCLRMGEVGAEFECEGSTPEEAVAKLYLELNKK